MSQDKLLMNDAKTELLLFGTRQQSQLIVLKSLQNSFVPEGVLLANFV